jgi:copper(I)-binding protein
MKFVFVILMSVISLAGVCEELSVSDAWSRATIPGRMGAVYATIENLSDKPISIKSIKTTSAKMAQIHESYLDDGVMRMRHMKKFTIPAGEVRKLEPGGLHIMLMRMPEPLKEGTTFEVKFDIDQREDIIFPVVVGAMGQMLKPSE